MVEVNRKTPDGSRYIGCCWLQYEDEWGDLAKELFAYYPIPNNLDEFNADNSSSTSTKRSSSRSNYCTLLTSHYIFVTHKFIAVSQMMIYQVSLIDAS
jgi:hypothetical protein